MIEGETGPRAVIDLVQQGDHLGIEHLVVAPAGTRDDFRTLVAFAEAAARAVDVRKIRLRAKAVPDELAQSLGYRDGLKTISTGALARARDHLEAVGVPLWRDGTASAAQTLYYRGVWAAIALLIGLGSVSLAVFSGSQTTLLHIVGPAVLCTLTSIFAIWQIASRRPPGAAAADRAFPRRGRRPPRCCHRRSALRPRRAGLAELWTSTTATKS